MKNYLHKIYIIHYTKLSDRKTHMQNEIQKWKILVPYKFFEEYDQEVLTPLDVFDNFDTNLFKALHRRDMKKGETSLCFKYKNILKEIAESEDGEYFLILEDDVIFKEDPLIYINKVIEKCENENIDFDCVFMGEAALRVGDNRDIFYKKDYPATNGLCTVLYKRRAIEKLYESLKHAKICRPMDWELNERFKQLNFNVYWGKAITEHGSVTAVHDQSLAGLKSSLRERY